jgi:hypothetical protein
MGVLIKQFEHSFSKKQTAIAGYKAGVLSLIVLQNDNL